MIHHAFDAYVYRYGSERYGADLSREIKAIDANLNALVGKNGIKRRRTSMNLLCRFVDNSDMCWIGREYEYIEKKASEKSSTNSIKSFRNEKIVSGEYIVNREEAINIVCLKETRITLGWGYPLGTSFSYFENKTKKNMARQ